MIKHIGKHNDRKIVVLYRQVPGEDHMCLVAYSDLLPRLIHDELMKTLESPAGQTAKDFADPLFRTIMADGRNCLETMHREGFIKKVPTNQVIITPNAKSTVRLDELNSIMNEMATGEEAIKRLSELDAGAGMTGKQRAPEPREVGVPANSRSIPAEVTDVLTDDVLAAQRMEQAQKMKASAQQLLEEAERLMQEAVSFNPKLKKTSSNAKKKVVKAN
jgi:hypothetical protein